MIFATDDPVAAAAARKGAVAARSHLRAALRRSFDSRGWLEIDTPVLIGAPAPEEYIETVPAGEGFLRPSPELEMKLLLAAGYGSIYQFGPCFRAGEHGRRHRQEFTMLEYYAVGCDYRALAELTLQLLREAGIALFGVPELTYRGGRIDLAGGAEMLTVADAFDRYAPGDWREAEATGNFDVWMVEYIEPRLGTGRPTFLIDYPASRASLARLRSDNPEFAERWELYLDGIEIANAYGELRDPAEQKRRFAAAARYRKENGMREYPEPEDFFRALEAGLPEVSGCALGFDRLAMLFTGAEDIGDVR